MTERATSVRRERVRPKTRRRRGKSVLVGVALTLAVLLLALGITLWVALMTTQHDVAAGNAVQIEIPSGASTTDIAELLVRTGVVDNELMFRVQTRLLEADGQLKAGVYDLTTGMSYDEAIAELIEGPEIVYVTVTIPEGFVVDQIAERLEAQAGIPADEFLALARTGGIEQFPDRPYLASGYQGTLEGYLFPKTYRIKEGSTARDVIEMMLDQFEKEIVAVDVAAAEQRGFTLHEIVTLASMIERETRVDGERELVSSVIHNRLEIGMRLEIDATIEYVLPGNRFRLRNSDLQIDSPFNSYKYAGLPPGPIASPGLAALQAAVSPADTDYIYYVLTGLDGSHTFATNFEEFLVAKRKSKEVFGQ